MPLHEQMLQQTNSIHIFLAVLIFIVIIVLIIFFIKKQSKKAAATDAETKRKELLRVFDLLEKDYLKRKINQPTFEKLFKEKQTELIGLEAEIQSRILKKTAEDEKILESIPAKKRHTAVELLDERKRILNEIGIARTKFLKREIDAKAYEMVSEKTQKQLSEVQAKIQAMQTEQDIKSVMEELKQNLKEIEEADKKKKTEREKEIVEEIIEQLDRAHYLK